MVDTQLPLPAPVSRCAIYETACHDPGLERRPVPLARTGPFRSSNWHSTPAAAGEVTEIAAQPPAAMPTRPARSKCRSTSSPPPPKTSGPVRRPQGIDVPLGRAGATRLQNMKLGKGTSQHVLVAGKTGSGKSTLLHALITNAGPALQSRRSRTVPDRLQAGRRVQDLRHAQPAARPRDRHRKRSRIRRQRAAAGSTRNCKRAGRSIPRAGRARPAPVIARPDPARSHAADPADRRRIPGILHRGRQDLAGSGPAARPLGAARPCLRHPRPAGLANARRRVRFARSTHRPDGACASPCNAARPTPT